MMNWNKKKAPENKKPARAPPPTPESQIYEAIPEVTYDTFDEVDSDEGVYAAPEDDSSPPPPARPFKKDPLPLPSEQESLYEASEEDNNESDESKDTTSGGSYKPPLPPPPRAKKMSNEDKKTKPKLIGHGLSLNTLQGALQNLKPKKPVEKQKSEEEHEPLSPKILKPVKLNDKKVQSPTSKPEVSKRSLPSLPSPQSDVNPHTENNTHDTSVKNNTADTQPALPPLPRRIMDEEEDIYVAAVSDPLTLFEWFHGDISREEGNKRVQTVGKDGTFLVRKSAKSDNQPYTMVLLFQGRVNNLKIRKRNDGRYALGEEKPNELHFKDVQSIVDYHKESKVNLTGSNKGETTLKESPSLNS